MNKHDGARPVEPCPHANWLIRGCERIGFGTCLDCNKQIVLNVLFNSLHDRMEAALAGTQTERPHQVRNTGVAGKQKRKDTRRRTKSREEAARFLEHLFIADSRKRTWHFGLIELRIFMDFIYGEAPKNEQEKVSMNRDIDNDYKTKVDLAIDESARQKDSSK